MDEYAVEQCIFSIGDEERFVGITGNINGRAELIDLLSPSMASGDR